MAASGRKSSSPGFGGKLTSAVYWLLGTVHAGVGAGIRTAGWATGWVVGWLPWRVRLAVLSAGLATVAVLLWHYGQGWLLGLADLTDEQLAFLVKGGILADFETWRVVSGLAGCALAAAALLALVPRKFALVVLQAAAAAFVMVWLWLLVFLIRIPGMLYRQDPENFKTLRNELWVGGVWAWVPGALLAALFAFCLLHRATRRSYTRAAEKKQLLGDRVFTSIRTHGRDPRYRTSTYWSGFLHVAVFFFPILVRSCGMEASYGIPKGSGVETIQVIQVKRIKRKKERRLVLNMNSPIIFHVPKIDESNILEEISTLTEHQYEATMAKGKPGKGRGTAGGWPEGIENAKVRFIRLRYGGGDWDQDMGFGADYNLLLKFKEVTGFKIASNTEALEIRRLKRFPRAQGPPFVYITGRGAIQISSSDVKTLRWYCLQEGGMLFADNGGGYFDRSFRALLRRVFPNLPLVDIASDDIIYQQPFLFPSGAPPLWHHSGKRALGLKHNGRWIVFYHQGDINDAWKTGHSGASDAVANRAYKMGINVIYYSFTQYLAHHHRK